MGVVMVEITVDHLVMLPAELLILVVAVVVVALSPQVLSLAPAAQALSLSKYLATYPQYFLLVLPHGLTRLLGLTSMRFKPHRRPVKP